MKFWQESVDIYYRGLIKLVCNYKTNCQIGLKRAIKSPGGLTNWQSKLGLGRRLAATAAKALNVALTPLAPQGIKLELFQRMMVLPPRISEERLQVAHDFFTAFGNIAARQFARDIMIENYTLAIMKHHPAATSLKEESIRAKCQTLVDTVFRRLEDIQYKPQFMYDVIKTMSRSAEDTEGIWFQEFHDAYNQYKHTNKLETRDQILFPHVVGDSLVDIGCGGGDQVADLKSRHPEQLRRVAGIDVLNWKTDGLDIQYRVLDFSKPGTVSREKWDTGMLLAVLHHAGKTDQEIATFLQGAKTAVGKVLIVEEDVLVSPKDQRRSDIPGLEEMSSKREEQPQLDRYLKLDQESQRAATTLTDLLGNSLSVGVPEMAFPFGFRSVSEWVDLFTANGFSLNKVKVPGFQKGNFNQQCHVHFILDVEE